MDVPETNTRPGQSKFDNMKIIRAIILFIFGLIWIAGCNTTILNELYRAEIIPDDYRYGDLYRLSNLEQFKDPKYKCPPFPEIQNENKRKIALYILGDSFTEEQRIGREDFIVEKYQFAHWATLLHLKLDTNYTNIIVLESVERKVREHFLVPIYNIIPDTATYISISEDSRLVNRLDRKFASAATEDRLTTILFQFDIMLKLKELKSWINYHFFDRTDPKVTVSDNGKFISYIEETDSTLFTSAFNHVSNSEVDSLVKVINYDQKYLKNLGFDKVLLAIIPNKTSIMMPEEGTYNHLLERVETHEDLEVIKISVYHDFKTMNQPPYLRGDSHWSCIGQYRWLQKVNNELTKTQAVQ